MTNYPNTYITRTSANQICERFSIKTRDSIQLFNKHEQRGIKTSNEKGKYYIMTPYQTTNKYLMRHNFAHGGTTEDINKEISAIKAAINHDYINPPNEKWQLGHKNPESTDNSRNNLVLQPPIQAKYKDRYIFIDTLTRIPTPKELQKLEEKGQNPFTDGQMQELLEFCQKWSKKI